MWILLWFGFLCSIYSTNCKPNGAPPDSCFYMTPRHIHPHTMRRVFPTKANGLYNITTSSDFFRSDRPIRVTLWGPPFKGFFISAAEEGAKDWPAGVFYSDDGSAEMINCLGRGDSATHVNSSYKDSVSLLWYGPQDVRTMEQVQFIATVVINMTIYYTDIKSNFIRQDPAQLTGRQGGDGGGAAVDIDPWLLGQDQNQVNDPYNMGRGGSSWGGTGSSWGSSSGTGWGSGWGSGTGSWGSGSGGWGSGSGGWGTGTGSSWDSGRGAGNSWDSGRRQGNSWNSGGQGGNSWGTGSQTGSSWGGNDRSSSWGSGAQSGSTWDWQGKGSNLDGSKTQGQGGSNNWNWGQTTTSAWNAATTTKAPNTTAAPASGGANKQPAVSSSDTGGQAAAGGSVADTKQSSIDWIKNIPTQTWYEILRRLGFGLSNPSPDTKTGTSGNSNTGSGGSGGAANP